MALPFAKHRQSNGFLYPVNRDGVGFMEFNKGFMRIPIIPEKSSLKKTTPEQVNTETPHIHKPATTFGKLTHVPDNLSTSKDEVFPSESKEDFTAILDEMEASGMDNALSDRKSIQFKSHRREMTYYPVNCDVSRDTITVHCVLANRTAEQFKEAFDTYCDLYKKYVSLSSKTCEELAREIIHSKPCDYLPEVSATRGHGDHVQADAQELLRGLHSYKHVAKNISLEQENSICRLPREVGFECSAELVCSEGHANQTELLLFCGLHPLLQKSIVSIENLIYQHRKLMTHHGVTPEYGEDMDVNPVVCEDYPCREQLRPYTLAGLYNAYQQLSVTDRTYVTFSESLDTHC